MRVVVDDVLVDVLVVEVLDVLVLDVLVLVDVEVDVELVVLRLLDVVVAATPVEVVDELVDVVLEVVAVLDVEVELVLVELVDELVDVVEVLVEVVLDDVLLLDVDVDVVARTSGVFRHQPPQVRAASAGVCSASSNVHAHARRRMLRLQEVVEVEDAAVERRDDEPVEPQRHHRLLDVVGARRERFPEGVPDGVLDDDLVASARRRRYPAQRMDEDDV